MDLFSTAFGNYSLHRLPVIKNSPLRAWDAADELLLNYVNEQISEQTDKKKPLSPTDTKILLINDQFGALSTHLSHLSPQNWSDSYQAHLATQHNLKLNHKADTINYIHSTQQPKGVFDLVLIKIPKTLALLEDQLITLKQHISADTQIVAAAMVKHIHTSTLKIFENILGTTTTSLAKKKARLIFPIFEKIEAQESPYPKSYYDKTWDITLSNHANVFAKEKLDMGSRFMLEQFKQLPSSKHIVDLGCGNGVLGIIAQRLLPNSHVTFIDESYMAVKSAKDNHKAIMNNDHADFLISDSLQSSQAKDIDLILCNPPFHQQHAISDHFAWDMFKQSQKSLVQGGKLWIVGNRHLGYHAKLKSLFGNCRTIASNKKFVVLSATKR